VSPELRERCHRWAEQSAAAQGLPAKVTDPVALATIAALLRGTDQPGQVAS
jgi:hypothetical protein